MAKIKKSQQSASKGKKKKWYTILAPANFDNKELGDSLVLEPENLMGKKIKVNLMTLTNDIKKQNIRLKFEVTEIKESKGLTTPTEFELSPALIKRYVRRKKDRLDESLVYMTKDEKKVRIKPFVLTRNNITGSLKKEIRKILKLTLQKIIASRNYLDLYTDLISYRIQKELRDNINKVVPIKNSEIRILQLEKSTTKLSIMPNEEAKVKEEEEETEAEAEETTEKVETSDEPVEEDDSEEVEVKKE